MYSARGAGGTRPESKDTYLPGTGHHFTNRPLKCVYLAVMSLDPTGQGRKRWTMRWKPALQAFDIAFDGRLSVGRR
jgi:hypothetical protein